MTGYGRAESAVDGLRITVEANSVNRKQTDLMIGLPRELTSLESRVRDVIHAFISRGRLNVTIQVVNESRSEPALALDSDLARTYYKAMLDLQKELRVGGEITIETLLRVPGVLRLPEEHLDANAVWPVVEQTLREALSDLITMREREGKNLARDLVKRLKLVRQALRKIKQLHPTVVKRYRHQLQERIEKAGIPVLTDDERMLKEIVLFADKTEITEELTRLESHFAQFAHAVRRIEPMGRTLDFMIQEIYRELNTLGAKANDAEISQLVVTCKAEMEKIREQVQNIE